VEKVGHCGEGPFQEYFKNMLVVGELSLGIGQQQLARRQTALMKHCAEQLREAPLIAERFPFEQSRHQRMSRRYLLETRQIPQRHAKKRCRPCFEPVRLPMGLGYGAQHIEDVPRLAGLEETVLLVECVSDARLAQVAGNFTTFRKGTCQYED